MLMNSRFLIFSSAHGHNPISAPQDRGDRQANIYISDI